MKTSERMSRIKSKETKPEQKVRHFLYSKGYRYRKNDSSLPGSPDIAMKNRKVAIFVNGCFWHGHDGCKYAQKPKTNVDFWEKKIANNKARDEKNRLTLVSMGYTVITVWECAIRDSFDERMNRLIREIGQ